VSLAHAARLVALSSLAALALPARAQQLPNPYGEAVTLDVARKAADAALAEARKNGWNVAAAVVDPHGELVLFERMENTQWGSNDVAEEKARSSARFKRPTKAFEDAVKGQAVNVLGLPGAIPLEGGVPILLAGRIVGAVGVSGATSAQDGQCARAGVEAIGGEAVAAQPAAAPPAAPAAATPPKPPATAPAPAKKP
jgi:glc operon protein GlcG